MTVTSFQNLKLNGKQNSQSFFHYEKWYKKCVVYGKIRKCHSVFDVGYLLKSYILEKSFQQTFCYRVEETTTHRSNSTFNLHLV